MVLVLVLVLVPVLVLVLDLGAGNRYFGACTADIMLMEGKTIITPTNEQSHPRTQLPRWIHPE